MRILHKTSFLGLVLAASIFIFDQLSKYWVVQVFWPTKNCNHLDYYESRHCFFEVMPFFDLRMVWNRGISYGLFQQDSDFGRYLLIGFTCCAIIGFLIWLMRVDRMLLALSLGLVIGGAAGNLVDRLVYQAVADFVSLHAFGFNWYIFNLADMAIVVGAAGLGYELLVNDRKIAVNGS